MRLVYRPWVLLGWIAAATAGLLGHTGREGPASRPPAIWTITVDEAGAGRLEVSGYPDGRHGGRTVELERLRNWANGVLGGGQRSIHLQPAAHGWGWTAVDEEAGLRRNLQLSGQLDLTAIQAACREGGWPGAVVRLELPRTATTWCEATGSTVEASGDRVVHAFPVPLESAAPAVAWGCGYNAGSLYWRMALPMVAGLLPVVVLVWMRRRALVLGGRDATAAWFGYWRTQGWLVAGGWFLWIWLVLAARWTVLVRFLTGQSGAWPLLLLALPAALSGIVGAGLSRSVFRRIRGIEFSAGETVAQELWRQAGLLLPLTFALVGLERLGSDIGGSLLWLGLALVVGLVGRIGWVQSLGMTPHQLHDGELRERIQAMAARAGVKLQQCFVMPAARLQMGNAFAVVGGSIILTDYLLENLERREVDAVIAHELGHLRCQHHLALAAAFMGTWFLLISGWLGISVPLFWALDTASSLAGAGTVRLDTLEAVLAHLGVPFCFLAALGVNLLVSRHLERSADRFAAELTADPAAVVSALVKISRMNLLPLQWGRLDETLATHPSTLWRARALATRHALDPAVVEGLLQSVPAPAGAAGYPIPAGMLDPARVFTAAFRMRAILRGMLITLVLLAGAPVLWTLLAQRTGAVLVWLAGPLAVPVLLVAMNGFASVLGYRGVRRRLEGKLRREGFLPDSGPPARFTGLAPSARPRVYEGHVVWDVGFLTLAGDDLAFAGDLVRFRLRRADVTAIVPARRFPGWGWLPAIGIRHRDAAGREREFRLSAQRGACTLAMAVRTRYLLDEMRRWLQGGLAATSLPPSLAALPPPELPEGAGDSPRQAVRAGSAAMGLVLIALLGTGAGSLAGLGPGSILYTVAVGGWAYLLALAPLMLYRDPPARSSA